MLLIVCGEHADINELKLRVTESCFAGDFSYQIAEVAGQRVVFAKLGPSVKHAAVGIGRLMEKFTFGGIFVTGGCAATGEVKYYLGAVSSCAFDYDADYSAVGLKRFRLPNLADGDFVASEKFASAAEEAFTALGKITERGIFASSEKYKLRKNTVESFLRRDIRFTDTDTAAIAAAAHMQNVPYCAVKCVCRSSDSRADLPAEEIADKLSLKAAVLAVEKLAAYSRLIKYKELSEEECLRAVNSAETAVMAVISGGVGYPFTVGVKCYTENDVLYITASSLFYGRKINALAESGRVSVLFTERGKTSAISVLCEGPVTLKRKKDETFITVKSEKMSGRKYIY